MLATIQAVLLAVMLSTIQTVLLAVMLSTIQAVLLVCHKGCFSSPLNVSCPFSCHAGYNTGCSSRVS